MNVRGLLKEFKKVFCNNFIFLEDLKETYKKGTKNTKSYSKNFSSRVIS